MTNNKGVLLFAFNNEKIKYTDIAQVCSMLIKKYLDVPVTIVTNDVQSIKTNDNVIEYNVTQSTKRVCYNNGIKYALSFLNEPRINSYELTPYYETIVMDVDYLVFSNSLNNLWGSKSSIVFTNQSQLANSYEHEIDELRLSDNSIDMFWATVFYFKKDDVSKTFFEVLKSVHKNYVFYSAIYGFSKITFRNDYAFTIAANLIGDTVFPYSNCLPQKLLHISNTYTIIGVTNNGLIIQDDENDVIPLNELDVHVMNKFDLLENLDEIKKVCCE